MKPNFKSMDVSELFKWLPGFINHKDYGNQYLTISKSFVFNVNEEVCLAEGSDAYYQNGYGSIFISQPDFADKDLKICLLKLANWVYDNNYKR